MRIFFHLQAFFGVLFLIFVSLGIYAQQKPLFKKIQFSSPDVSPLQLFVSNEGKIWILSSDGVWHLEGGQLKGPIIRDEDINGDVNKWSLKSLQKNPFDRSGCIGQGLDSVMYFVTRSKIFFWKGNNPVKSFNSVGENTPLYKICFDKDDNIYESGIGSYVSKIELQDSIVSGHSVIKKFKRITTRGVFGNYTSIHSLAMDKKRKNRIWLGTDIGLFYFRIDQEITRPVSINKGRFTVTEIYTGDEDKIWFSTLEKGMGVYDLLTNSLNYYPYRTKNNSVSPIKTFCYKKPNEFFVAALDSLPAIF